MTTKQDLRASRRHSLNGWLIQNGLSLDEYPFWPQAAKDGETAVFAGFDATYESAKDDLRDALVALEASELGAYFAGIGWSPVGETAEEQVDDYFDRA